MAWSRSAPGTQVNALNTTCPCTPTLHSWDGDNWGESDNRECLRLVHELLDMCNVFGYGEINEGGYTSPLMGTFSAIKDGRFIAVTISDKKDVYPALKKFFRPREGVTVGIQ